MYTIVFCQNPLMGVLAFFFHWFLCNHRYMCVKSETCYEKYHEKNTLKSKTSGCTVVEYSGDLNIRHEGWNTARHSIKLCYLDLPLWAGV